MAQNLISREKVAERGEAIYVDQLRSVIETPANIGKIVVIDVLSGDYEIGTILSGLDANVRLRGRQPEGEFYGIRIGYDVVEAFGGLSPERTKR